MRKGIILVGGGGHCRACIDVIEATGSFAVAGIVDRGERLGERILGYEIMGDDTDLPVLAAEGRQFLVTVGHIKSGSRRRELFESLAGLGADLPVVISPLAYVSSHAVIGAGAIVMHRAHIGPLARIGANCIINTGAVIEHDTAVEDHCHISTGAIVNGKCTIGSGSFIGSNSVIVQGVKVGWNIVVGAGAVVTEDLVIPGIYVGIPARRIA